MTLSGTSGGIGVIGSGTAVASTSGTSIDFTSLPAGLKRITVMLAGVSLSGTSSIRFQLGAGSVQTTGYTGSTSTIGGASAQTNTTGSAGFDLYSASAVASSNANGLIVFCLLASNQWVTSGTAGYDTAQTMTINGKVTLGGALDRVRITTVNGTDTFDAGSINILYE
jgi:hypothetical protein